VNSVVDNAYSRVVELEAWGGATGSSSANINWLVPDHLGTPRIILDQTGSFANVKRHDYLPFGEELPAGTGGRTPAMGYVAGDGVRQQFTAKERDVETGLDYFEARYYSSAQGRFTSVDPENYQARQDLSNPQSWNAYSYVNNNPLRYIDPDGNALDDPSFWQQLKEIWHNGTNYGYWMTNAELHAAATAARTQVAVEFGIVDSEGNYHPIDLSRKSDGEALRIRDDLVTLREAGQIQNMGDRVPEGPAMQPPVGLGGTQKPNKSADSNPRDTARQRGSELVNKFKDAGEGVGRSGGGGNKYAKAGAELIREANKLPKNNPLREAMKIEGKRLIQYGKSVSHK
jgi:RHS repeat-associated protein